MIIPYGVDHEGGRSHEIPSIANLKAFIPDKAAEYPDGDYAFKSELFAQTVHVHRTELPGIDAVQNNRCGDARSKPLRMRVTSDNQAIAGDEGKILQDLSEPEDKPAAGS
jgi:hypothetical protein